MYMNAMMALLVVVGYVDVMSPLIFRNTPHIKARRVKIELKPVYVEVEE